MEFERLLYLLLLLPILRACRENEFYSFWFMNWKTCDVPNAPVPDYVLFVPGCYCLPGYFFDKKVRECRQLEDCSRNNEIFFSAVPRAFPNGNYTVNGVSNRTEESVPCPDNEEFLCGCRTSCGTQGEKCVVCRNGCHCRLGFVRNASTAACVPMEACAASNPRPTAIR